MPSLHPAPSFPLPVAAAGQGKLSAEVRLLSEALLGTKNLEEREGHCRRLCSVCAVLVQNEEAFVQGSCWEFLNQGLRR